LELFNFTPHLADLPSDFPFLDVLSRNYIPKFWEEILFEAILLKLEKFGSIHSRDEARTTNTPKNWDVSWTSSSAANRAPEHDLHSNLASNLLKLGPKLRFKLHPSWLSVNHPNVESLDRWYLHWRAKRMHVTNGRASQLDARFLHYFSVDYLSKYAIRESYFQ